MMNGSKKTVQSVIIFGLVLVIVVVAPFIQLGINLFRDLKGIDIINVSCLKFAKTTWAANGGVLTHSWVCIDAGDTYDEVVSWYRSIGWYCDGGCEYHREKSIGPFTFYITKFLDPFPERVDTDFLSTTHFDLYINYDVVLR
jgi:hypothetical protein